MPVRNTQRLTNRNLLGAGLPVGATMAGLAAATLTGAGSANASCVSFSGMGNNSQCNTSNFGDVAVVIGNGYATAQGGGNVAWAIGNKADAIAAGKYNLAFAQGNTGPNPGMVVTTGENGVQIPATDDEDAFAEAVGFGNRAIAIGDGATAAALGGDGLASVSKFPMRRAQVGNNTSITIGKGSNSYAGSLPPKMPPGNAPKNQFAAAVGDHRNAINNK
jgi:hypothetical protein